MVWEIPHLGFSKDYIQNPSLLILAHLLWLGMMAWEGWERGELVNEFLEVEWSSIQTLRNGKTGPDFLAKDFESFEVGNPEIYWIKIEHSGPWDICSLNPKL